MRKIAWLLVLVLLLGSCSSDVNRRVICRYVLEHQQELEERIESGNLDGIGPPVLEADDRETCIEFECGGSGFGPETAYWGFFYTPSDDIHAVWCAPPRGSTISPEGEGQRWREPDGDNEFYVEHIVGHFYYYEASF